jgi:hypothetical protein
VADGGCLPKPVFTLISVELAVNPLVIIFCLFVLWLDPFLHYHVTHVGCDQLLASVQSPVAASSGGSATAARVLKV